MDLDRVLVTARELRIAAQLQGDADGVARVTTALLGDLADMLAGLRDDLTDARARLAATVAIRESDRKTSDLLGEALDGFLNTCEKYGIKREPLDLATPEGLSRSLARDCGVMRSLTGVLDEQLAEARAEIAALRGLPEGAVSGWAPDPWHRDRWDGPNDARVWLDPGADVEHRWIWELADAEDDFGAPSGSCASVRDAMRAADNAAGVVS